MAPSKQALVKIDKKIKKLEANGLTLNDRKVLEQRLNFQWVKGQHDKQGHRSSVFRRARALDRYSRIEDADSHLYLVSVLVFSPTTLYKSDLDNTLEYLSSLANYNSYHFTLGSTAKDYFETTAKARGYDKSSRYLSFLQALFPPCWRTRAIKTSRETDYFLAHNGPEASQTNQTNQEETSTDKETEIASDLSSYSYLVPTEHRKILNASQQGVAEVFSRYICGTIRRGIVGGDVKACVTMTFPVWGEVACLMSLDICEEYAEQLLERLLTTKMKRTGGMLHLATAEKTFIIPDCEMTLKGVSDVTIVDVFGSEIYDAIEECPIRQREFVEETTTTDCVSVMIVKSGLIINLSLGLRKAQDIYNKLYP